MSNTVIITGASGGLGRMLAMQFAGAGFNLILQHCYTEIGELIGVEGISIDIVKGNLRQLTPMNEIVALAEQKSANVLINNAGVHLYKPFDEMTDCEIKDVIEVNLLAPMLLTRKLWHVLKANSGIVININSVAGKEGSKFETAYSASKHGLAGFSKALQFDGTKDNVRVVDVFIGKMITEMTTGQEDQNKYIDPYEVAQLISQLCSDHYSLRTNEIVLTRRNY